MAKTTDQKLVDEYNRLIETIEFHNRRYYVFDDPQITDQEYDKLYRQLRDFEETYPELRSAHSPTLRVGGEVLNKFKKVEHAEKMLSLDNTYSVDELQSFLQRTLKNLEGQAVDWTVEPKIDGLSIELVYENRQFVLGSTRGDGLIGEDVTHNLRTIPAIPLRLPDSAPAKLTVRGEVYINKSDLDAINKQRQEEEEAVFKNCRNAAAGAVRVLDSSIARKRRLRFKAWGLLGGDTFTQGHYEALQALESYGFSVNECQEPTTDFEELLDRVSAFEKRSLLPSGFAFPVDGLVIKVNRFAQQQSLGATHKYPRFAISYKFETEKVITQVKAINVQVGRTGALTPVAELTPIEVSGSVVSRATLHNEDEIKRLGVMVGDWVEIEKAGEVIPKVIQVISEKRGADAKRFIFPKKCPACGTSVKRDDQQVAVRCPNSKGCLAQLRERLLFFVARNSMNIDHLGPAVIDQLLENQFIQDAADFFTLKKNQLAGLDRLADKSAQNIIDAIEKVRRQATLTQFITALGIPQVGQVAATLLAEYFGDIKAMITIKKTELSENLQSIDGIGPVMAESIVDFLSDSDQQKLITKFIKNGLQPRAIKKNASDGPLKNLAICITGKLSQSRSSFQKLIEQKGGTFHSTVKKDTNYLVIGESKGKTSSKQKLAEKFGTQIIDEAGFTDLFKLY